MPLRHVLAGLFVMIAMIMTLPNAAEANDLDQFRAQGVIAERYDGFVELRTGDAPAAARALVDEVNAQRRQLYQERAAAEDAPVDEVGKVYAERIVQRAPVGTYFRQPDGSYIQR